MTPPADDANIRTVLDAMGEPQQHERDLRNHVRVLIRFNRARVALIARYLLERGELAGIAGGSSHVGLAWSCANGTARSRHSDLERGARRSHQ